METGKNERRAPGPRRATKLTVKAIDGKALHKVGVYSDGANLFLRVRRGKHGNITRSWLFAAYVNGKRRDVGLGGAEAVTLQDARAKAAECRAAIADGRDPVLDEGTARHCSPGPRIGRRIADFGSDLASVLR